MFRMMNIIPLKSKISVKIKNFKGLSQGMCLRSKSINIHKITKPDIYEIVSSKKPLPVLSLVEEQKIFNKNIKDRIKILNKQVLLGTERINKLELYLYNENKDNKDNKNTNDKLNLVFVGGLFGLFVVCIMCYFNII